MMTDIVERLREQPTMSVFVNIGDMIGRLNSEREEAADEIERLREALKQAGLYAWQGDTFKIMDIVRETFIGKEK